VPFRHSARFASWQPSWTRSNRSISVGQGSRQHSERWPIEAPRVPSGPCRRAGADARPRNESARPLPAPSRWWRREGLACPAFSGRTHVVSEPGRWIWTEIAAGAGWTAGSPLTPASPPRGKRSMKRDSLVSCRRALANELAGQVAGRPRCRAAAPWPFHDPWRALPSAFFFCSSRLAPAGQGRTPLRA